MGSVGEGKPFAILYVLIALSVLLVIVGMVLHRRGALTNRSVALVWAVLSVAPLFGAGALFWGKHQVEQAEGITQPGVHGNALSPDNR